MLAIEFRLFTFRPPVVLYDLILILWPVLHKLCYSYNFWSTRLWKIDIQKQYQFIINYAPIIACKNTDLAQMI